MTTPTTPAAARVAFERDAEPMGFDLRRHECMVPEPWSEYHDINTGHRWGGYLAATHAAAARESALIADVQRYRYLRDIKRRDCLTLTGPDAGVWCDAEDEDRNLMLLTEDDLDQAIDAAMQKERKWDAVLAGGSPLQQHPAPSPAQAVMQVGCENIDGTLNIHPETETCSICEPAAAVDAEDEWDAFQVWRTRQQVIADNRAEGDDWIDAAKQVDGFIAGYRAALQAARQPQAQQGVAAPLELKVCHSQNASQTPQTGLSLMAAPQEWSPAYTRGPARQSAPVTAVPAMVPLTEEQMVSAVRPLCNTDQVAERLVAVSIDEYRAIEAAIAKLNGLTVGYGAQPIKDTP